MDVLFYVFSVWRQNYLKKGQRILIPRPIIQHGGNSALPGEEKGKMVEHERNMNGVCYGSMIEILFKYCSGILVPGGFGSRGIEGKIVAARYAREKNIPYLGEERECLNVNLFIIPCCVCITDRGVSWYADSCH